MSAGLPLVLLVGRRVAVPLKCFAGAGTRMAALDTPFALTMGGGSVSIARVAFGTDADRTLACT